MTFAEESDYVNEKPEVKTGWAQAGKLTQLDSQKSVQVQANFGQAENYTIQFGMVIPTATSAKAEALITWTVEGNPITRRVSVSNGLSVTGVGQGVKVVVKDVSTAGNKDYDVSISVARGIRATTERPPTLYLGSITLNSSQFGSFTVPLDAGAQSVFVSADQQLFGATDFIFISQTDSGGVALRDWILGQTGGWVPLEPGCVTITVLNSTAQNGLKIFATLGIDG